MITPFQQRAADKRARDTAEIESAKKTLEDATTVGAGFWVSYLFLIFYIAVSAGAVTHVDLFLENRVKLPFLNLELELKAFFFLAPILFLIMHMFTLSKLVILSEKARRFLQALEKLPRQEAREKLRRNLPSNIFVQSLVGPEEISRGGFGWLLRLMGWITMAVAPVLLLIFIQVQFLPYHSFWLTWEQRAALLLDILLLWWLWRRVLKGPAPEARLPRMSWPGLTRPSTNGAAKDKIGATLERLGVNGRADTGHDGAWSRAKEVTSRVWRHIALPLGLAASGAALGFSFLVATFPSEWKTSPLASWQPLEAFRASLTKAVFRAEKSFARWPYNTLQLEEFNIFETLKLDDSNKLGGREFTVRLKERRLEGAKLSYAKLGKADLRYAELQGATLDRANMQGATLVGANMQGAMLVYANMQGASLEGANMQGAMLAYAKMQGAMLFGAKIQDAMLFGAEMQGATLVGAKMQGATLVRAKMQGAMLACAKMQGATLDGANMQGALLVRAKMQGATLIGAYLWRADFSEADLTSLYANDLKWNAVDLTQEIRGDARPWNKSGYEQLCRDLIKAVPEGEAREAALKRIESLECKEAEVGSDCAAGPSPRDVESRRMIEAASEGVTAESHAITLSKILEPLVCGGDENAIHVLRSVTDSLLRETSRLEDTGANAPKLVDHIMSPACPVSTDLTSADKARLLEIKRKAEAKYPPKPAPDKQATKK